MLKAYRFRLYPHAEQQAYFANCFGSVTLSTIKCWTKKSNITKRLEKCWKTHMLSIKRTIHFWKIWIVSPPANAQLNLEKAYKNFFWDKSICIPKFKSCTISMNKSEWKVRTLIKYPNMFRLRTSGRQKSLANQRMDLSDLWHNPRLGHHCQQEPLGFGQVKENTWGRCCLLSLLNICYLCMQRHTQARKEFVRKLPRQA